MEKNYETCVKEIEEFCKVSPSVIFPSDILEIIGEINMSKVTDSDLKEFIEKTESGVDHKTIFKGEMDMDKKAVFKFAIGDSVKVNDKDSAYDGVTGTIVDVVDSEPKFNTPVYKVDDGSGETRLISEHKLIYYRGVDDEIKEVEYDVDLRSHDPLNLKRKNTGLDLVNHPPHYEGNIECIDAMQEVLGKEGVIRFCIGNAFKYIWRCFKKHATPVKDLEKCRWYINKALDLMGSTTLEQTRWIPVSERYPTANGWYQCTVILNNLPQTMELFYKNGKWLDNRRIGMFNTYDIYGYGKDKEKHKLSYQELSSEFELDQAVIAWKLLPRPYKAGSEG